MFTDLREFIKALEDNGELRRINKSVSTELEITEILDRLVKSNGPAVIFENVKGFDQPVVGNLFGSHSRMALALGVENVSDISLKVKDILQLVKSPPESWMDKIKALTDLFSLSRSQPKNVKTAPCHEVIKIGDEVDLNQIPALKCWPGDAGKFITFPLVISRDPITGNRNVGTYRMQVYDERSTGMHWQTHKGGAQHDRVAQENNQAKIEVAAVLGADPVTMWSGSLPLPPFMDELMVSGVIRGKGIDLVKCKTINLEVPANAEIVLEGYITPGELRTEGPFGDHTGYYSEAAMYPVFHITAITSRKDAIYPAIVVGRPPSEDYFMGFAGVRLMLPALQMIMPEIVDLYMPAEGIFHNLIVVSIKKEYPGQAKKVMYGLWGFNLLMLTKAIIVVDETVDIYNSSELLWRVTANIDPIRDITILEGPLDDLDHSARTRKYGSKVGIDATSKTHLDGNQRGWPEDVVMDDITKSNVDLKWKSYGL